MAEDDTIVDFVSGCVVSATPEELEVQAFARRLVEDFGYAKERLQVHPQFRVRKNPSDEKRSYPVDIAVFRDSDHSEGNLFLIVECKRKGRAYGLEQLKLYLSMSHAEYGVWFNGDNPTYIRKIYRKDGTCRFEEVGHLPLKGAASFSDFLRLRREELRLKSAEFSVRKLAKRIGIDPTYLSRIEAGDIVPAEDVIVKLARELGVDEDILVFSAGKVPSHILDVIIQRPKAFAELLFALKDASKEQIEQVTERVKQVRDGDW